MSRVLISGRGRDGERRRLLLREAIMETCKAVICPAELRKKYGKVLDFSFDLVVNYQRRQSLKRHGRGNARLGKDCRPLSAARRIYPEKRR